MDMGKTVTYSIQLGQEQSSGDFLITWAVDPWLVGYDDYIAIYESYADLEKDFQRGAEGKDPTYQKTYEWVRKHENRYWATGYPAQSGWLIAYFSKTYQELSILSRYQCFMWTPGW